ncbi:TetR/AcrR family transcriptional regulator [Streptomyces sp. M19]
MATTTGRRSPARERILGTADELFSAHGLRGVGVDRIIAESGVAKATLYAHFPQGRPRRGVSAALRRAVAREAAAGVAGRRGHPREQLVGLFDAVGDAYTRHGFHGCPSSTWRPSANRAAPRTASRSSTRARYGRGCGTWRSGRARPNRTGSRTS